jgi:single-strand DNA-binding protein
MNSVQLIGRLTADPELRFTTNDTRVCTIRLAIPGRWCKGGTDPAPLYINVVTYGSPAEALAKHLTKGRRVSVTGRLEYREWTTADKVRHSIHEVVASQIDFLDAPPTNGDPSSGPTEEPF